jgi:predicted SnoaL-like aldol condensation-catalyzing enzyme
MRIPALTFTLSALVSSALSVPTPHHGRDAAHCPGEVNIRDIFSDYVHIFYTQRNYSLAMNKYIAPDLIQHNPTLANGRDAEIAAVLATTSSYVPHLQVAMVDKYGIGPAASNSKGIKIAPDTAGFAMIFTRWTGKPGTDLPVTGVADVYRIDSCGLLAEHWDVIEALPENATNPDPF